ncbi:MAG: PD-(D/E)XK nuclease family protein, partial [Flavobacteriaceae bacterium]
KPSIMDLISEKILGEATITSITQAIAVQNKTYVAPEFIHSIIDIEPVRVLFPNEVMEPNLWVKHCITAILLLKEQLNEGDSVLEKEYLYRFYTLFDQLSGLLSKHGYVTDLKALKNLYHELLRTETLDFRGNPLQGLQVMGMLESRNLDFENVILTSVNEGILPSGKANNSFIPYDVKKALGLPTYKEKDAVYTYHFYRLLQRAKRVFLLYNTEPDVLEGGEKSRLISQLLAERLPGHTIHETIAAPKISLRPKNPFVLSKDSLLLNTIKNQAGRGFSPSSLSNYIKNPLLFYKQNILRVNEVEEVEETMAANTFGTVVHDALETLYKPFLKKQITPSAIDQMKPLVKEVVAHHFKQVYGGGPAKGKNLIAKHVMERYIQRFLSMERNMAQRHDILILGLEENLSMPLNIPDVPFPVLLRGKLDRVDVIDGQLRIIDYKTGKVESKNVTVREWDTMFTDYTSNKAFQLLCYSLMYSRQNTVPQMQAGIVSFKNLSAGLLPFTLRENGNGMDFHIDTNLLHRFESSLTDLIAEICNPNVPFHEKEPLF